MTPKLRKFLSDNATMPTAAIMILGGWRGDWLLIVLGGLTFAALRFRTDWAYEHCGDLLQQAFKKPEK